MTKATVGLMFTLKLLPATGTVTRSLILQTSRSACG
nr:MAG TPA: hypothetical protein [Caudoviricetes sp.]